MQKIIVTTRINHYSKKERAPILIETKEEEFAAPTVADAIEFLSRNKASHTSLFSFYCKDNPGANTHESTEFRLKGFSDNAEREVHRGVIQSWIERT